MKAKATVRVVKKQTAPAPAPGKPENGRVKTRQAVRQIARTVNTWVDEFQQRREDESLRALRTRYAEPKECNG
jgi:hypothetical protein